MAGRSPDTISQVKQGIKSVFHRKKAGGEDGPDDQVSAISSDSAAVPVEAPAGLSTRTPQLTTTIPGSSLGPEAHHAGMNQDKEDQEASQISSMSTPPRKTYAEGMSATSGPVGNSLEEIEQFERMVERRSSARAEDADMAASAVRKVESESTGQQISEGKKEESNEAGDSADSTGHVAEELSEQNTGDE